MRKKEPKKDYKDSELNKLKKRIHKLEKENNRLKSELNAYDQAFKKTTRFLRDNTEDISIEKLIDAARLDKSLKEVQEDETTESTFRCPICSSDTKSIPIRDGSVAIVCNCCSYRTVNR